VCNWAFDWLKALMRKARLA
ncbi:bacterial DNA polymerase III alpha subunit, partial [Vibrio parahaemolyticus V-223/04]